MASNPDNLTNAMDGLPGKMVGKVKVHEWKSKAAVHKRLQTVRLVHDGDQPKILPMWSGSYDIEDVVITRKSSERVLEPITHAEAMGHVKSCVTCQREMWERMRIKAGLTG